MTSNYKAIGGVERAALYPADAVATALFSSEGCEVELSGEPIEVELLEDMSSFEESSDSRSGVTKISHQLNLVADRREAEVWFDEGFVERCSVEGVVAVISLCDGRQLLVGYSARFGDEQPLHLSSLTFASGSCLHDKPTATLRLVSHDTEFSHEIL